MRSSDMATKLMVAFVCLLAVAGSARAAKVWFYGNGGAGVFGGGTYVPTQNPLPLLIP